MSSDGRAAWSREINAYTRAISGAYIFGVPLLFTMEMWWIGEYIDRSKLLMAVGLAFAANFGLSWVSGFRRDSSLFASVEEAIEAVAVGTITASAMLLVLNRIALGDPIESVAGMILVQAVPLSIGASVANEVFGRPGNRRGKSGHQHLSAGKELLSDVGATMIGGVFIGFSIAPTEEVPMLAAALDYPHLLALVAFSLGVSYIIVFASGFDRPHPEGVFQQPITETALAYVVSVVVALVVLYLFDRITFGQPLQSIAQQALVLAVPTTVGGAAGRLVV
ncbi:MAG TPA: TIGR02587 family membrane protein [Thermomicrobiales bacterium]|nr:TIGR02587 family membrane protein [Thermomicrobiales bacterium]